MIYEAPKYDQEGKISNVFNVSDFETDYNTVVTRAELKQYANKNMNNRFYGVNEFSYLLFNTALNDVSVTTFSYLKNVTSDIQYQLDNIGVNLKSGNNVWTGENSYTNKLSFTHSLNNISPTVFGYLSGTTSNIQGQLNNMIPNLKSANNTWTGENTYSNKLSFTNTLNNVSPTVFGYLSGTTSNVQSQFNAITQRISGITYGSGVTQFSNHVSLLGSISAQGSATVQGNATVSGTLNVPVINMGNVLSSKIVLYDTSKVFWDLGFSMSSGILRYNAHNNNSHVFSVGDVSGNAYIELCRINKNGFGNGIASPVYKFHNVGTCMLDGVNLFTTSLNGITPLVFSYLTGCTSNIQSQLDNMVPNLKSSNNTWTGENTYNGKLVFTHSINNVSPTTFAYLLNVNSDIQNQFNAIIQRLTGLTYSSGTTSLGNHLSLTGNATVSGNTTLQGIVTSNSTINGQSVNLAVGLNSPFINMGNGLTDKIILYNNGNTYRNLGFGVSASVMRYNVNNGDNHVFSIGDISGLSYIELCRINKNGFGNGVVPLYKFHNVGTCMLDGVNLFTTSLNGITPTVFSYLSGATSNIQTQLNNLGPNLLASNNSWTGSNSFNGIDTITGSSSTLRGSILMSPDSALPTTPSASHGLSVHFTSPHGYTVLLNRAQGSATGGFQFMRMNHLDPPSLLATLSHLGTLTLTQHLNAINGVFTGTLSVSGLITGNNGLTITNGNTNLKNLNAVDISCNNIVANDISCDDIVCDDISCNDICSNTIYNTGVITCVDYVDSRGIDCSGTGMKTHGNRTVTQTLVSTSYAMTPISIYAPHRYNNTITIRTPLSIKLLATSTQIGFSSRITNIVTNLYKNGVLFSNPVSTLDRGNLPGLLQIDSFSKTNVNMDATAEWVFSNIFTTFSIVGDNSTYTVEYVFTFQLNYCTAIVTANTNVKSTTLVNSARVSGGTGGYLEPTYTETNPVYGTVTNGLVEVNELICNSNNNLVRCKMIRNNGVFVNIDKSIPAYNNFYNNGGTGPITVGSIHTYSHDDVDECYIIYPGYRLQVWDAIYQSGTVMLDYTNNTVYPQCIKPTTALWGSSCKLWYKGQLIV